MNNPTDGPRSATPVEPGTSSQGCPEGDSFMDESSTHPHPKQRLTRTVTSLLRRVALFLVLGGGTATIVWRTDFRQPGALSGTADGVVVGVLIGSIVVAAAIAVLAYVIDLLFLIDWDRKFSAPLVEESV
jgi:hypothetical protein